VDPQKQIFKCFGCGKGGNVVKFLMDYENVSFLESIKLLADSLFIDVEQYLKANNEQKGELDPYYEVNKFALTFFVNELKNSEFAQNYLLQRGISKELISDFKIGYAPNKWDGFQSAAGKNNIDLKIAEEIGLIKRNENGRSYDKLRNRIIFPILNISGYVIGFGGRALDSNDPAKYINSPDSKIYHKGHSFYGIHSAIKSLRKTRKAIICEGYIDLIALRKYGFENSIAVLGTGLTDEQARLIKRYVDEVYLIYDGDEAGKSAAKRGLAPLLKENLDVQVVVLPEQLDPDDFLSKYGKDGLVENLESSSNPIDFLIGDFDVNNLDLKEKEVLLKECLELVANYTDILKKKIYTQYISDIFKVSESTVVDYLKEAENKKTTFKHKEEKKPIKVKTRKSILKKMTKIEIELLKIFLNHNEVFIREHEEVNRELFITEEAKKIYQEFWDMLADKGKCGIEDFLMMEDWQEYQEDFVALVSTYNAENAAGAFKDLIVKLKVYHFDEEIKDIRIKLKMESDETKILLLLKELNILKQMKTKLIISEKQEF